MEGHGKQRANSQGESFAQESLAAALRELDQRVSAAALEMPRELDPLNAVRITLDQVATLFSERQVHGIDAGELRLMTPWLPRQLAKQWELTPFDIAVLLIALAPELDPRYERVYAFLQDDITRTRPSVHLAFRLLCGCADERIRRIAHFLPDAPLIKAGLLRFDPKDAAPVASKTLHISDLMLRLVAGDDEATLPPPSFEQRQNMWEEQLVTTGIPRDAVCATELAALLPLTRREIRCAMAATQAQSTAGEQPRSAAFMRSAIEAYRSPSTLGRHVPIRRGWQDLILNQYTIDHLQQLGAQIGVHPIVRRQSQLAGSMAALFTGPSGTGKTLAAEVLAGSLKMNLFRVSASRMFDKYVGETEKNIDRMFELVEQFGPDARAHTALLVDEAEWLFSGRVEGRDSHDHYLNLRVGHLLQRLEAYDGVVILTSNLPDNIDSAFQRRWFQHITFEMPDVSVRRKLWARLLERSGVNHETVSTDAFARALALSGGSIRNVVALATYDAIAAGGELTDERLAHAAVREYRKLQHTLSVDEVLDRVNAASGTSAILAVAS